MSYISVPKFLFADSPIVVQEIFFALSWGLASMASVAFLESSKDWPLVDSI